MTAISREDIAPGDIVSVQGYGGFAEVLHIEQDGYTPPPACAPKWRVTIKWGPNNTIAGRARVSPVEDFPLGRLVPAHEQTKQQREDNIEDMDEAQILARLAQLNAQLTNA